MIEFKNWEWIYMGKFKDYSYDQRVFLPASLPNQVLPGTFEYALNHVIDNDLDLSAFRDRAKNDDTGAPAYDPAILLKIILYAYSRGKYVCYRRVQDILELLVRTERDER